MFKKGDKVRVVGPSSRRPSNDGHYFYGSTDRMKFLQKERTICVVSHVYGDDQVQLLEGHETYTADELVLYHKPSVIIMEESDAED